jgi:replicative DNA helicase
MTTTELRSGLENEPESPDTGFAYRTLPHNIEAEQALLGAVLINNEVASRVSAFLRPEHFFQPIHGRIYDAAQRIVERGQRADPVTLKHYFESDDALADIGGAQYLARLAGSAVTIINAEDYGRTVHDLFLRRELISLGEDIVNTAFDFRVDAAAREQIEDAEQHLFTLAEEGQYDGGFEALAHSLTSAITMMESAYKREGGMTGVATGLRALDDLLGGLHPSDLVILAGRPSMGKTALATNIAFHAAKGHRVETDDKGNTQIADGAVVGFFSLEMSAEQLAFRLLAEETGISSEKLRRGQLSGDDFQKVVLASQQISRVPFFIDDTPALSVAALRTRARRLKRTHNLSLVVVDYLQLLRPSRRTSHESRVLEIAEITQSLKALAKELNLPVLALSQLSRAVEQREDKRPLLSDLRESGAIEQDADVVMFIFREEYYLGRSEPTQRAEESDDRFADRYASWQKRFEEAANIAEVFIAKQRHGPIGKAPLYFDGPTTRFGNLDTRHTPGDDS